ncbi:hypothetical protein M2129_000980 [Polynucleobacter sphagniphilus]|uniref:hypothetical protein n=1 Tax=Polynucleobacter sphagniphilus TaxID=1743169 RepID=UPI00247334FF|nr:hypothetical protein [Polynucleobacter sphagniphilus]MDH6249003.1 hypothetical protein [Polynucleobacter sphagniphilus]
MPEMNFSSFLPEFEGGYDSSAKEKVWRAQSAEFREFWVTRVMGTDSDPISDEDCDKVIKILDSNGKGNNKHTEAIARAMVSQGAWRRLFNELHKNKKLGSAVNKILTEQDPKLKAQYIDDLYGMEEAQKIYLTGKSGNTISAFIAAFDPFVDLSIISLKDRKLLLEYLNSPYVKEIDAETIGSKIVHSNAALTEAIKASGVIGDARKISNYCYYAPVRELWRGEFSSPQEPSGNNEAKEFVVTVATDDTDEQLDESGVRDSIKIQGLLAKIGEQMGFDIWLPNPDRARVAKVWQPRDPRTLLTTLPLSYDKATQSTIGLIDVIWIKNKRSIARAFEVEHTTSIYSGILRMADLVALQPDIKIKMHIVAPLDRQEKFSTEIRRPVFSYMTNGRLSDMCTFISYDDVRHIAELEYLHHTRDGILESFEVSAEQPEE